MRIQQRVQACMQNSAAGNRSALEKTLWLLSRIYGGIMRIRNKGYDNGRLRQHRLPRPVISVGNLTAGGSGKTPMTLYLTEILVQAGYSPAVISRGYKGKSEKTGGVVSDGRNVLLGPVDAGDEPFMMANQLRHVPFLVGADRYAMGKFAIARFSPDVIILDDAFQHRRLGRNMDLVLVDAAVGFGNGYLLPRGILREPMAALARADAVVLTRSVRPAPLLEAEISQIAPRIPVFRSVNRPYVYGIVKAGRDLTTDMYHPAESADFRFLRSARVLGFSGIARSTEFQRMIAEMAGSLVDFLEFPDHYYYTESDWHRIVRCAADLSVDYLLTTQKDYARLQNGLEAPVALVVIGIYMDFGPDRDALWGFINNSLNSRLVIRQTDAS
ncbi:MAG: tetraacyldisaccharide 4'-kinase [Desulfobacterales bacterium]|nr:tetraacyldisaccharide 4'-kinase [Desulfobacterales bacterium]